MMGCMGGPGRPFYASLLDMPALTAEARRVIEAEAERRIGWGSQAITSGQARLHHALVTNDTAVVQQAAAGVREGLLLLESGTAALRAIEAGTAPRQLALTWFRDQLGRPPPALVPVSAEAVARSIDPPQSSGTRTRHDARRSSWSSGLRDSRPSIWTLHSVHSAHEDDVSVLSPPASLTHTRIPR